MRSRINIDIHGVDPDTMIIISTRRTAKIHSTTYRHQQISRLPHRLYKQYRHSSGQPSPPQNRLLFPKTACRYSALSTIPPHHRCGKYRHSPLHQRWRITDLYWKVRYKNQYAPAPVWEVGNPWVSCFQVFPPSVDLNRPLCSPLQEPFSQGALASSPKVCIDDIWVFGVDSHLCRAGIFIFI